MSNHLMTLQYLKVTPPVTGEVRGMAYGVRVIGSNGGKAHAAKSPGS